MKNTLFGSFGWRLEVFWMMNKQKGNMYPWVTHTWNPIKGRCPHRCCYCYMKKYWNKLKEPYLDEKCLKDNLGSGNIIFVGSSIDMWANDIPDDWILKVLSHCRKYPNNTYLFQSKNPFRFSRFRDQFPPNTILGTTLETNRDYNFSKAPQPRLRVEALKSWNGTGMVKMVSIEPIMDFDLDKFISMIALCEPVFVSIGADSKRNNLPEPPKEKIVKLISELRKVTKVRLKNNLKRLGVLDDRQKN